MPFAWQVDDVIGVAMNGATWVRVSGVLIGRASTSSAREEEASGARLAHVPLPLVLRLAAPHMCWQLTLQVLVSVNRRCVLSHHSLCL